jgi:membrane complex biogenesis BtpA family protein
LSFLGLGPQRVADFSGTNLVIANEAWKDRQAGRGGRMPAAGHEWKRKSKRLCSEEEKPMSNSDAAWNPDQPMLIGMLHLPPLPGSPGFSGDLESLYDFVRRDAEALIDAGFSQLMIENFGDAPFFPDRVSPATLTHMTALAQTVRSEFDVEVGINVLRNDGCGALAVAHAARASFIRVNVLCGARLTDQGVVHGIAHDLLRLRATLGARSIRILADVDVKHSAPLADRPIEEEVEEVIGRGGADAVVVSGEATGRAIDPDHLERVLSVAGQTPVLIGSGATEANLASLCSQATGLIVGSALKVDGVVTAPVDLERAYRIVQAIASRS